MSGNEVLVTGVVEIKVTASQLRDESVKKSKFRGPRQIGQQRSSTPVHFGSISREELSSRLETVKRVLNGEKLPKSETVLDLTNKLLSAAEEVRSIRLELHKEIQKLKDENSTIKLAHKLRGEELTKKQEDVDSLAEELENVRKELDGKYHSSSKTMILCEVKDIELYDAILKSVADILGLDVSDKVKFKADLEEQIPDMIALLKSQEDQIKDLGVRIGKEADKTPDTASKGGTKKPATKKPSAKKAPVKKSPPKK